MRKRDVRKHAMNELPCHLHGGLRLIVERGHSRKDGGTGVGGELHVAQVNAIERSFAHAQDERPPLFEADIGGSLNEIRCESVGDGGEGSHGAGKDDHRAGGVASAGDAGADVGVAMLPKFAAGCAEEFFCEAIAPAEAGLFRKDAERIFRRDKVDAGDAVICGEGAKHLGGVDAATGSGDGEGDVAQGWICVGHRMIIAQPKLSKLRRVS